MLFLDLVVRSKGFLTIVFPIRFACFAFFFLPATSIRP